MTFGHPLLLLTLFLVPLVALLWWWLSRRPVRHALTFTNLEVLASVVPARSHRRYLAPLLALLALATLCVAVARPHRTVLVPSDKATVMLVIDVSGSMQATDVKPTRLAAAQAAVETFLDKVPEHVQVGLIAFAGEAQVVEPPTADHDAVRQALATIGGFGFNGTAIGDALKLASDTLKPPQPSSGQTIAYYTTPAPAPAKPVPPLFAGLRQAYGMIAVKKPHATILFLSDGHQTRGELQPLQGAAVAKAARIPVYTIALGTPNGTIELPAGFGGGGFNGPQTIAVPPDPFTLRAIARMTGGKFFEARSARAVEAAYSNLGSIVGRDKAKREATSLFLALAAILLVAAGVLAALVGPRLP